MIHTSLKCRNIVLYILTWTPLLIWPSIIHSAIVLQTQELRVVQEKEPYIRLIQENLIESSLQTSLSFMPN